MTSIYIQLFLALEAALIATAICIILAFKIKSLNKTILHLKEALKSKKNKPHKGTKDKLYLEEEIQKTQDNFNQLHTNKNISHSLQDDIINIQALSLRFHTLQAEHTHLTSSSEDTHFDNIIHAYETHIQSILKEAHKKQLTALSEQLNSAQDELLENKKTISHLESLKYHYEDLEEHLASCQDEAQNHMSNINALESNLTPDIKDSIEAYAKSYDEMAERLNNGKKLHPTTPRETNTDKEIENLRLFAASQHKMIEELQEKLRNQSKISHDEETMSHITNELSKQRQFVKESETCIQLMEDELANASREISGLKAQAQAQTEQQLDNENKDLELSLLKEENKKLKELQSERKQA